MSIFYIGFSLIQISIAVNQCKEDKTNQVAISTSICDEYGPKKCDKIGYSKICTNGSLDENFAKKLIF